MIPKPSLIKIDDNCVKLNEETISETQASVLKKYFNRTKDIKDKQIKQLIIDSCYISDKALSILFEGVVSQQNNKGVTLLHKLHFTNGKLGLESVKVLAQLIPNIRELAINNIQTSMNKQIARRIIESII